MAIRTIREIGDEILTKTSKEVSKDDIANQDADR